MAGRGGAVFYESVQSNVRLMKFVDSVIEGAAYGDGGAIYTLRSAPRVERCTVTGRCLGDGRGGCIYGQFTVFSEYRDSSFRGGRALWGGAIYGHSLRINGCLFEDNATWSALGPEPGGGEGCDGPMGLVSCVALPNSSGQPAEISAFGSTDVSVDRVVLLMTETPTLAPALLLASQTTGFVPYAGGGAGTLCLGGPILRFPPDALTYESQTITYRPILSEFPGGAVVQAGQSWLFQFWFRDVSAAGPTSNFSPALFVGFQ